MSSVQTVDLEVLEGLDPSDRTLLADYCFLETASTARPEEDNLLLKAIGLLCEMLNGPRFLEGFIDVDALRKRRLELSDEAHRGLSAQTELWLGTGEPEHLVDLLAQLRA